MNADKLLHLAKKGDIHTMKLLYSMDIQYKFFAQEILRGQRTRRDKHKHNADRIIISIKKSLE